MKFFTDTTIVLFTLVTALLLVKVEASPSATPSSTIVKSLYKATFPSDPVLATVGAASTPVTSTSTATTSIFPPTPRSHSFQMVAKKEAFGAELPLGSQSFGLLKWD